MEETELLEMKRRDSRGPLNDQHTRKDTREQKKETLIERNASHLLPGKKALQRSNWQKGKTTFPRWWKVLPISTTERQRAVPSTVRDEEIGACGNQANAMEPWISCVVTTVFDDDKGPVIDSMFPRGCFSERVENEVKMLSLPRSSQSNEESYFYVIRVRVDDTREYLGCSIHEHDYMYGYVYFQCVMLDTSET